METAQPRVGIPVLQVREEVNEPVSEWRWEEPLRVGERCQFCGSEIVAVGELGTL